MESKIDLEELALKHNIINGFSIMSNTKTIEDNFNNFVRELVDKTVELCAENATLNTDNEMPYDNRDYHFANEEDFYVYIDKQSILKVKELIK